MQAPIHGAFICLGIAVETLSALALLPLEWARGWQTPFGPGLAGMGCKKTMIYGANLQLR
jgi:hypothetical protein